jgi:hypothetical protein
MLVELPEQIRQVWFELIVNEACADSAVMDIVHVACVCCDSIVV